MVWWEELIVTEGGWRKHIKEPSRIYLAKRDWAVQTQNELSEQGGLQLSAHENFPPSGSLFSCNAHDFGVQPSSNLAPFVGFLET
jgi:hypothetical protein